ncbi:3-hydroxybutyrate dehydrogenase [Pseudogulbenkiania sp. MAI-1]|uniref:3-hydroxybutyrate dehydrogenase n=1 Tax=Pseudogulbenkiania sp. MAI-1 TaxID=990370 RepID=UPI00045EA239|nr:3-hydroxybutyrate dehydrogenase [Pseudogulbenkiania sp. MAI-1]
MTALKGKTALVTGSTSGIGLAIARTLAQAGADVVLNGFGEIDAARDAVAAHGGRVGYHGADMRRADEIAAMIDFTNKEFGGVDILVNNAGIQHVVPVDDFPADKWDDILAINLSSAFHATKCALLTMRARGWGRIVNVASVHGLVASVNKSAYVAAKHGLVGLTKTVALELAETGITCNAICPGWVQTPLAAKQFADRAHALRIDLDTARARVVGEKQPSGKVVTPEQLGALVAFLCSDAAAEVRGVAWAMDGGWTAQ